MAKEKVTVDAVKEKAADEITLNEFCARMSGSDRRVEMIGAFHHVEKKAGRIKDGESNYKARFDAFVNQPA